MKKTYKSQGFIRLALTESELVALRANNIPHADVSSAALKTVYVEIDKLERIVKLLDWKKNFKCPDADVSKESLHKSDELRNAHTKISNLITELESKGISQATLQLALSLNVLEYTEKIALHNHSSKSH
ncbi:MAG: hypothetical protein HKN83_08395 [Gammaproteobacteria bacterium]|nr:hypothetical protein [Gammaproteobacteria bacterium]